MRFIGQEQKPKEKLHDDVNQRGMRVGNCFRCQAEVYEKKLRRVELKSKDPEAEGGDLLLLCRKCRGI